MPATSDSTNTTSSKDRLRSLVLRPRPVTRSQTRLPAQDGSDGGTPKQSKKKATPKKQSGTSTRMKPFDFPSVDPNDQLPSGWLQPHHVAGVQIQAASQGDVSFFGVDGVTRFKVVQSTLPTQAAGKSSYRITSASVSSYHASRFWWQ